MMTNTMALWSSDLTSPAVPRPAMSPLELDGYLTGIIVTPQPTPILPDAWITRLWGEDGPIFDDEVQIKAVLATVIKDYNALVTEIDRGVERLEVDNIVAYRPLFQASDAKPAHDNVRTWVRGFWQAMTLAPETWSKLAEDERAQILIRPFVGFFDLEPDERGDLPEDIDAILDEDAALIPRMILVLRKLARIRQANAHAPPRSRRTKIGRNDPCSCGSGQKYKRCCGRA